MLNLRNMTLRQLRKLEAQIDRRSIVSGLSQDDEVLLDKISDAVNNREYDILNNRI